MTSTPAPRPLLNLSHQPGHLIRRAQQITVARFRDLFGAELTTVQYAALRTLQEHPGVDQVTLAKLVALDTSTTAELARRLETKGWIVRKLLPRRQRSLVLTPTGEALLADLAAQEEAFQQRLLADLEPAEQAELTRLLGKLVRRHDEA